MRKRSGVLTEERPENNYLASVSDLFSGLIFVFIITLVVFALQLREQIEQTEKEKTILLEQLTGSYGLRAQLLDRIKTEMSKKKFEVEIDAAHGILRLPEEMLFPSGSANLEPQGERMLEVLAKVMVEVLPDFVVEEDVPGPGPLRGSLESIFIEGHTDTVPIRTTSSFNDNWDLSTARAINTFKELTKFQPALDAFRNTEKQPLLSVSGYAYRREVASNETEAGRKRNRRIDIRFIMTPPKADEAFTRELAERAGFGGSGQ